MYKMSMKDLSRNYGNDLRMLSLVCLLLKISKVLSLFQNLSMERKLRIQAYLTVI